MPGAAPFSADYARYYDQLYSDKDCAAECRFLEQVFSCFALSRPKSVLDLGCGTGNHGLVLAAGGFSVTGVDASPGMIALARKKACAASLDVDFHLASIAKLQLPHRFDAAICLFQAINYMVVDCSLADVLTRVRRLLIPGGLFVFEFRNALAANSFEPLRVKWIYGNGMRILRISETSLFERTYRTKFTVLVLEGRSLVSEFKEEHWMTVLDPNEVEQTVHTTGFELLCMTRLLDSEMRPAQEDWNLLAVLRVA